MDDRCLVKATPSTAFSYFTSQGGAGIYASKLKVVPLTSSASRGSRKTVIGNYELRQLRSSEISNLPKTPDFAGTSYPSCQNEGLIEATLGRHEPSHLSKSVRLQHGREFIAQ
jgi:hypothetical protein